MPRNPENPRVEILLSPEQYAALKEYVQYEFLAVDPDPDAKLPNGAMSEAIHSILRWAIPSFANAKPLARRGQYERKSDNEETSE